jgi:large repetitive protein
MRRATKTALWGALLVGVAVAVSGCAAGGAADDSDAGADPDGGIEGPLLPQCSDGIDNDGDGLIDYPEDPGCFHPLDNSEEDDCPNGPRCPQCADGIDNDADGRIDWPDDPGCASASDNDESTLVPTECGVAVPLLPMPVSGIAHGSAEAGGTSELSSNGCGGAGAETVYLLVVQQPGVLVLSTDFPETTLDTVLYVRTECAQPGTELGCNDRASGSTAASSLTVEVEPGPHYIIVDAHSNASSGNFKLQAEVRLPLGTPCDPEEARCAPGLLCQPLGDATEDTCVPPRCSDGVDNDGDGLIDYPNDPGCLTPEDNDESDDCPDGPGCPACGDGIDNDGDGLIDYPDDPGCLAASHPTENECTGESDLLGVVTAATMTGNTAGLTNDFTPSCSFSNAPDKTYVLAFPGDLASLRLDTAGSYDTILAIKQGTCEATDLACNDSGGVGLTSLIQLSDVEAGTYFVIIDGYSSNAGDYFLNVSGVIRAGQACDQAQIDAGIFTCEAGLSCTDGLCPVPQCSDGIDNDGDGLIDYPEDPGCLSPLDDDETDDCPDGPNCPECADGIDNDGDGLIDYPADPGCVAASHPTEHNCAEQSDPIGTITAGTMTGSTAGLAHDFQPSCTSSTSGPDKVYVLSVPGELVSLQVDTVGSSFDSMLAIKQTTCTGTEIGCHGALTYNATITVSDVAPGSYFVIVDGWAGQSGAYTLNVSGVIRTGEACDQGQIDAGIFSCQGDADCVEEVCADP